MAWAIAFVATIVESNPLQGQLLVLHVTEASQEASFRPGPHQPRVVEEELEEAVILEQTKAAASHTATS